MTKNASSQLQDRLARSLDQANRSQAQAPAPALRTVEGCQKLSISLFPGDLAALNAIRDLLATDGRRISTSQAVKLALRTAPLDLAAMRQALDAIQGEDRRGKW
jgi:hypothetical protein